MRPRILIPLVVLVLSCMSSAARADCTLAGNGVHAHIHKHGTSTHLHTHTESHTDHSPFSHACDDDAHEDCCGHHDHHPELFRDAHNPRERDLPTFTTGIVSTLPDFFRFPKRVTLLRWAPLRQRPPEYLGALRTCVMLN